jgi:FKBP-type peptidyl-prolyl cis-trans isomerase
MRRRLMLLAVLGLAACNLDVPLGNPTNAPNDPSQPDTETFAANLNINISQMTKTSMGDYYKDLKVGGGATLTQPQVVIFSYETFLKTGVLVDGAVNLQQDLSQVVRGLQDGMIGMQEGGERVVVVPSALAFGDLGKPPIPPNATLVFDVLLKTIP